MSNPQALGRKTQMFILPFLPDRTRILLDEYAHTAILDAGELPVIYRLTPSATKIFRALLQAYPHYCEYGTLLSVLYPTEEEHTSSVWHHHVRPVRNALRALMPALQSFGLEVIALRKKGYLLAPARSTHIESDQRRRE